jgi:hypothetical protein
MLAVGTAALALLAGTGAAVATTGGSSDERDAYLAAAAKRLGVSVGKLEEALKGAALERLDAAVAEGRIDADRAAAIRERIQSGEGFFGFGHGFGHGFGGFFFHGLGGPGVLAAAADYLGLDTQALLDKLRSGQSLADVAKAQGKSVDGLKQALLASAKERLDAAVKDGRLTSSQAKDLLDRFQAKLDDLVGAAPPFGRPFFRLHRGIGF